MGLFGKKKKPSKGESAQQDAAAAQAAQQSRALAAKQAADAQKKAAFDAERLKEDNALANIGNKRQDVKQLQDALERFETSKNKELRAAAAAKKANKQTEMQSHLRSVTRLKKRITQYENQVVLAQQQLDALEDAHQNRLMFKDQKNFTTQIGEVKVDAEDMETALQDVRQAMSDVNEANLTLMGDANLNKGEYDMGEAMEELEALEELEAQEATLDIPDTPAEVPSAPAAKPAASLPSAEEEELRKLEADIAL